MSLIQLLIGAGALVFLVLALYASHKDAERAREYWDELDPGADPHPNAHGRADWDFPIKKGD